MDHAKKSAALRQGVIVLVVLAALTGIEYVIGTGTGTSLLLLISLFKAVLVVQYFMHVYRLFSSEEGGH
jgi:hypothetical protein